MEMNLNGLEEWGLIVGFSCLPDDGPKTGILYLREERIFDESENLLRDDITGESAGCHVGTSLHCLNLKSRFMC